MNSYGSESEVMFFNRVQSENRLSSEVESDPRHADIIASELGLTFEKTWQGEPRWNGNLVQETDCLSHRCCLVRARSSTEA